jgi:hypothetical protein
VKKSVYAFMAIFLLAAIPHWVAASESVCADDKRVIASCFDVAGRLSIHANLRPYLHVPKTRRILGIALAADAVDGKYMWPENIERNMTPEKDIWGNYRVCPLTSAQAGTQQLVCIDAVSDMRVQPVTR